MKENRWLFVFAMLVFAFEVAAQSRADLQIKDARITPQSLMTGEAYDVAFTVRNGSGRGVEPYTTFSVTIPSGFTYRSASFEVTSGVTYACVAEGGAVACKSFAHAVGSTIPGSYGRAVLAVGVLQGDLAVSKREQITTMDFHPCTICSCSRECPLRDAPVSLDKVPRIAPMGVRESRPDLRKANSHGLPSFVASAADVRTCRGLEYTVLRHE